MGETGPIPVRENLRDAEKDDKNVSKPVARHFNLPNRCKQDIAVYIKEARKVTKL